MARSIPRTMDAVRLHSAGIDGLRYEQVETPRMDAGEALIEVHAAAVTRDELEWPVDRLPAVPSYELSGVVAAVAADVATVAVGAAVYALTPTSIETAPRPTYAAVPASLLAPKPSTLDHVASAAIPLAALSAWQGLFDHGRLEEGERVLIHGAAGGVGHFATQLARWRGAHVIGTASPGSLDAARAFGAHEVLDGRDARLEEAIAPVDLVFDTVGGELLVRSRAMVRPGGRLVSVAEEAPPDRGTDRLHLLRRRAEPGAACRARTPGRRRDSASRDRLGLSTLRGACGVRARHGSGQAWQGRAPRCR